MPDAWKFWLFWIAVFGGATVFWYGIVKSIINLIKSF